MKKILALLLTALFVVVLAACGSNEGEETQTGSDSTEENGGEATEETQENTEIVVGASSTPHAVILEEAKPLLAEKGITLKIEQYQDYIFPNKDLANGTLDANYFQHVPYLNDQEEEFGYDFVNLGGIHIEPMGVYSKNIKSVDEIPDGTTVIISRSIPDHGRILALFEEQGLIKLKEGVDKVSAKIDDIVENPKNLNFDPSVEAALLPEMYDKEEDALVAINTNYAIEADLNPTEDSLFIEGAKSPYVNVVAARSEDKDNEALKTLVEVLQSEEIQNFIKEEFQGNIVPAPTEGE
ncbi:MetQ/NlpA family ABC transporter substrate-binding protein [Aquibacillus sp. 3ASR75-11]|uniref:Lipoprotein n=1 Tax=Terrihalobacillus insolitus TaxID=2950438 RepID=A0A9X3WMV6_9BACI|nr:MetQ/NlpA family ABC transporter substrate-binding protein [Terrihalobacillus insolitus]MDC3412340.1 MetQ/NlpA family ABC transporter substrate-binding protein [Terrihalobacillus insolitus]MDC3422967.1 MetQ/NlpA family ABC transporter substrate-binding protein [Terrihalobacillus insolitus]